MEMDYTAKPHRFLPVSNRSVTKRHNGRERWEVAVSMLYPSSQQHFIISLPSFDFRFIKGRRLKENIQYD